MDFTAITGMLRLFEPSTTSPIGRRAKRLEMGVISIHRDGDIVCSAWKHAAAFPKVRKSGTSLAHLFEHQDFSTVVATKKIALKNLENYSSDLLHITAQDELLGFKHVFQTQLTRDTIGDRIRSPMGMFTQKQTFMDNDAGMLLGHLHEYYYA